jgi:hypothetical protein
MRQVTTTKELLEPGHTPHRGEVCPICDHGLPHELLKELAEVGENRTVIMTVAEFAAMGCLVTGSTGV